MLLTTFVYFFLNYMSMAQSPASRGKSRERSQSQTNQVPFSPEFSKMLMKSSPRFGSLSHHSFFSRHNPHPNRVKHIQGEVVVEHIFKVVVLKSMILSIQFQDQPEEEFVLRKTQYSAETGRIIPSSTNSYQRRPYSQRLTYPQTFHDQELMVFELLCQILQTDSLSAVQQWLLLAGQRGTMLNLPSLVFLMRTATDGNQKNSPKKPLSQGNKGRDLQESNRGGSLSPDEQKVTTHSMNMTEIMNNE
uniref:Thymus, brain and testes associated n=1 Tax=Cyclopterus lumpus TaxID=8103 RepID=A0A8C2ZFF1_CYCLU